MDRPIPSFREASRVAGAWCVKPRILVLEVRDRAQANEKPIAWLMVEREETYQREKQNGPILAAKICISYQLIQAKFAANEDSSGEFEGSYTGYSNSVSISGGFVVLDLPGLENQHIGTYLMNEIVLWARQWPDANVAPIRLVEGQAHGNNKDRRNWFYWQFGLEFDWVDASHKAGVSRPMLTKALTPVEKWKENITEHLVQDYFSSLLYAEQTASSELEARDRACKDLIDSIRKAEKHPILWMLKELYYRHREALLKWSMIALVLGAVWHQLKG